GAPRPCENHGTYLGVAIRSPEGQEELPAHDGRPGVQALWAVEGDGGDTRGLLEPDGLEVHVLPCRAPPGIGQRPAPKRSPLTWFRAESRRLTTRLRSPGQAEAHLRPDRSIGGRRGRGAEGAAAMMGNGASGSRIKDFSRL